MKRFVLIAVATILFTSCSKDVLYISSPDKREYITVITEKDVRYIIEGRHESVPEEGYIKLDISTTTELSDAIYICWRRHNEGGEIVVPKTTVIENRMEPSLYTFDNKLPEDKMGVPRPTKFAHDGCTSVGFSYKEPYPEGSAIIEEGSRLL